MKIIFAIAVVCLAVVVCDGFKIVAPQYEEVSILPYLPRPRPRPFWLGYPFYPQPDISTPIDPTDELQIDELPKIPDDVWVLLVEEAKKAENVEATDKSEDAKSDDEESVDSVPEDEEADQQDDVVESIED